MLIKISLKQSPQLQNVYFNYLKSTYIKEKTIKYKNNIKRNTNLISEIDAFLMLKINGDILIRRPIDKLRE